MARTAGTAPALSKPHPADPHLKSESHEALNNMQASDSLSVLGVDEIHRTESAVNDLIHTFMKARGLCQCREYGLGCDDFTDKIDIPLLRSIKHVIEARLTELLPDDKFTFKQKRINNKIYWYAVWWDKSRKRKIEKYVSAGERPPEASVREIVMKEKLRREPL